MSKKNKQTVKTFLPELIPSALLKEHNTNSNKQSKHVFKALRDNIREKGFDEALIVRPDENGEGYVVVAGNHRFRAGKAEGMEEFPCVVRSDWDSIEAEIQSVRRNYSRGAIDADAFTAQVNMLVNDHGIFMGDLVERFGFEDPDKMAELYKEERKKEQKAQEEGNVFAPAVKIIDDLGMVLSHIYQEYGDTVHNSFIIFPAGGKHHMFVAANPALKRSIEQIAYHCINNKLDINIALGGLLAIGIANSEFMTNVDKAREAGTVEGDSDIEVIK